jgi:hypothetical protein
MASSCESSELAVSQENTAAGAEQWPEFIHDAIFLTLKSYLHPAEHESQRRRGSRREFTSGEGELNPGSFSAIIPWETFSERMTNRIAVPRSRIFV